MTETLIYYNETAKGLSPLPFLTNYPYLGYMSMTGQNLSLSEVKIKRVCSVEGCRKPYLKNGYCNRHALQIKNHGIIYGNPARSKRDPNEFVIDGDICRIKIYNDQGYEVCESIIDAEDAGKCKKYKWGMSHGYAHCGKTRQYLHEYIMPPKPSENHEIDHANRNNLYNRKSNLRFALKSENAWNSELRKNNKSGFKGVSFDQKTKKWKSQIRIKKERIILGYFKSKIKAAMSYNKAALKYHGRFAYLNEIPGEPK